jgi:hypothetical protein
MPFFQNLLGTSSLLFRLGVGSAGLYWKNDGAGRILARNGADGAYVQVAGLNPTAAQDFVTLDYLGSASIGGYKTACRVASTANIAALTGLLTIDGVVLVANDRVLVKDQSTASQNGIYVAAAGAWARASDFAAASVQPPMQAFPVSEGTVWADSIFVLTTNAPITVGVTSTVFQEQGPVFRSGSAQPLAARINRGALSAPIDATKLGVVSLGSQSSGGGTGVLSTYGTCGGGDRNTIAAAADYATCAGGLLNTIQATHGFIGGGQNNVISTTSTYSVVAGGQSNQVFTSGCTHAFLGGGSSNTVNSPSALYAVICGGQTGSILASNCSIVGGANNIAGNTSSGGFCFVGGGTTNHALGFRDVIAGGQSNRTSILLETTARTQACTIGGGENNVIERAAPAGTAFPRWGTIPGGSFCRVYRDYGFATGDRCRAGLPSVAAYTFGTHGFAHGIFGQTTMDGQYAHGGSGGVAFTTVEGEAQYTRTILAGLSVAGAATTLRPNGSATGYLRLENNKSYTVRAIATAKTSTAGTNTARYFVLTFICRVGAGGIVVIAGAVTTTSDGDAVAWTLVPTSSGAADNTLTFTFTAVGPDTARCVVAVEMVELIFV